MGYTTEFDGSVAVTPPLNPSEIDYLARFADSRRFSRVAGPYALDETGFRGPDVIDYNQPPEGQPSLWCNWAPTADGTAIGWNEAEKFYDSAEWMQYLIDTFLRPGATLQAELAQPVPGRVYDDAFAGFTFDHTVNGTIDAQGEDPDDTWRLVVQDNLVSKVTPQATWPEDVA
jgi:hypothetical protein